MELMKSIKVKKCTTDLVCFTLILFLWLLIKSLCQPYRRGFWCDDLSIRYPHKESSPATLFLLVWCFILPAITIIVFETISARKSLIYMEKDVKHFDWRHLCWKLYKKLSVFYLGAVSLVLTTTVIKYSAGRLRPDFWEICRPDIDCSKAEHYLQYIENYTCLNAYQKPTTNQISDARMSFISGHSAYSSYCVLYFCIYLHRKMKTNLLISLRAILQLMSLLAALFISINRISINKHHWSDVFVGLLLGTVYAIITTKFFLMPSPSDGCDSGSMDLVQSSNTNYKTSNYLKSDNKLQMNSMTKNFDSIKNISQC